MPHFGRLSLYCGSHDGTIIHEPTHARKGGTGSSQLVRFLMVVPPSATVFDYPHNHGREGHPDEGGRQRGQHSFPRAAPSRSGGW